MVDYDLIMQSTPTGVEMKVSALGESEFIVTNKTRTYASGTVIEVIAPPTVGELLGSPDMGWRFLKWENASKDPKRTITLTVETTIIATYEYMEYYPTRHPVHRYDKFFGKVDEEVYGLRTTALKPMMVEQMSVVAAQQDTLERLVGTYLNAQGLYGTELHHYRNFSQELYGLTRIFKAASLNAEASLKGQKWKDRGLDPVHLQKIADLFNITLTLT